MGGHPPGPRPNPLAVFLQSLEGPCYLLTTNKRTILCRKGEPPRLLIDNGRWIRDYIAVAVEEKLSERFA